MPYDVIVIGGSFAGLSAAMMLARARRKVLVIDAGKPRNRFAAESHGFFAQDGVPPLALIAAGREKLLHYPNVRFVQDAATRAQRRESGGFAVTTQAGETFEGSKLLLATGVVDELPALAGLQERWGATVLPCPYCHGYEFGGAPLGVLYVAPLSSHQAALVAEWGPLTFFTQGNALDADAQAMLTAQHVRVEPAPIVALLGEAPALSGVQVADGRVIPVAALYLGTRTRMPSPIAEQLGCSFEDAPFGPIVRTNEFKLTTVPGVYAAGDAARAMANATWASSDGVTAGASIHRALVFGETAFA